MIEPSMYERLMSIAKQVSSSADYTADVSEGSSKGDNYVGKIYRLKIDEGAKSKSFIVKAAEGNGAIREKIPIRMAFLREMFMYERVSVEFKKLQAERGLEESTFDGFPKCYYTVEEEAKEALVLEDLNDYGYKMWDRKKPMDDEHLKLVLKNYGKFHAFSFALKDQKPEVFKELTKDLKHIFEVSPGTAKTHFEKHIDSVQKVFSEESDADIVEILENLKKKSKEITSRSREINQFSVITHGDCWCNNMMFRYQDSTNPSRPTSIRMLDFQVSFLTSVVCDLSYFFYVCASYESYKQLDRYLKIYHDSFSSFLQLLGSDPSVFTFQDLKDEWKKFCMQGFWAGTIVLRFMLSEPDEVPDMKKLAEKDEEWADTIHGLVSDNSGVYKERVRDLVKHLVEEKFIS